MRRTKELAQRFFKNRTHTMYGPPDGALGDDELAVEAYYQPREDDTNTAESVTIECVWHENNGNAIEKLTAEEVANMETELLNRFHDYCNAVRDD